MDEKLKCRQLRYLPQEYSYFGAELGFLSLLFWLQSPATSLLWLYFLHLASSGCFLFSYFLCILHLSFCLRKSSRLTLEVYYKLPTLRLSNLVKLWIHLKMWKLKSLKSSLYPSFPRGFSTFTSHFKVNNSWLEVYFF